MARRRRTIAAVNGSLQGSFANKAAKEFTEIRYFDYWHEFTDATQAAADRQRGLDRAHDAIASEYRNKSHTRNFAEAMSLAVNGWPEGAARIKQLSDTLSANLSNLQEQEHYTYDVTGQSLDIGMYLSGEPECWQSAQPVLVEGLNSRILTVVIDMGAYWDITAEQLERKGAMACSLVQLLEAQGYRVTLKSVKASEPMHGGDTLGVIVTVKQADNILDLDRVAFAIAHPAMNRRLLWAHVEEWRNTHIDTRSLLMPEELQGDIYIPWTQGLFDNDKDAEQWIAEQVKQLTEEDSD